VPAARERGTPALGLPRAASPRAASSRAASSRAASSRAGTSRAGTVSSTSAARFAARVRRRRQRRAAGMLAALAGGLGLGWVVFASPLLAVRHVQVRGTLRLSAEQVADLASGQLGRSMALASPQAVAGRVAWLPLVRSVRVERSWPSTLVVSITERQPLAAVPSGRRVDLVDGDGVVVETVAASAVPGGLPLVDVDVARAGAPSLRAARAVSDDLPAALRPGVRAIRATSPDAVSFVLADGSTVVWGSAQDGDRKAAALLAVHPRPTKHKVVIDVSAPGAPAVTER
jgi:cell division protein FtsQ